MTTIFENDFIKVSTTNKDYDFINVIENKTNKQTNLCSLRQTRLQRQI